MHFNLITKNALADSLTSFLLQSNYACTSMDLTEHIHQGVSASGECDFAIFITSAQHLGVHVIIFQSIYGCEGG